MSSRVTLSSEKSPPWRTKNLWPIKVASGKAEKLSEKSLKVLFMIIKGVSSSFGHVHIWLYRYC